jgi:hypothetical protein
VELQDHSGNVLVTVYVQGTGVGPQVSFLSGSLSSLSIPNLNGNLNSIAIDGQGNLYIAENIAPYSGTSTVVKESWTGSGWTQSTVMSGLDQPLKIALDGAGKVYVADISSYQPLCRHSDCNRLHKKLARPTCKRLPNFSNCS